MNDNISIQDNILNSITYDDLITGVTSNEQEITEKTITKVYNEILQEVLENAKETLRHDMKFILKQCK